MENRTIKFRAWNGEEMIYTDDEFRKTDSYLGAGDILKRFDTVMQFTGLKDVDGKEIYEGDIRKGNYFCMDEPCEVIEVMEFWVGEDYSGFHWKTIKGGEMPDFISTRVIGNIHEDAGLLAVAPTCP